MLLQGIEAWAQKRCDGLRVRELVVDAKHCTETHVFLREAVRTRPALFSLVLQVRVGQSSSG